MPSHSREQLQNLYSEIAEWGKHYDPESAPRRVDAVNTEAALVIVAEAYARSTVRVTGVNWYDARGGLGNAGRALEVILNCVGQTVAPPSPVKLPGAEIAGAAPGLTSVYTTDVFPCYPTQGGHPSISQVRDAIQRGYLQRELGIVRPRVILLLGRFAHRAFHQHLLGCSPALSVSSAFSSLRPGGMHHRYEGAAVLSWLHPSGASPAYSSWVKAAKRDLCEQPQIRALADALNV
jgi:uracil-DNA glycosylase